jgi:uncharacterized membrane protein
MLCCNRFFACALPSCLVLAIYSASVTAAGPVQYSLTELRGLTYPGRMNNSGDVAGSVAVSKDSPPKTRAALWLHATHHLIELGTLGGTQSAASGINDCLDVVGQASLKGDAVMHAALFRRGRVIDLDPKGAGSGASSINNKGVAVGYFTVKTELHPALFQHGLVKDLTGMPGGASAISLTGEIAGTHYTQTPFVSEAFIIQDGVVTNISPGGPAVTDADDINDYGQIVGNIGSNVSSAASPFLYPDLAIRSYVGDLPGKRQGGSAINDAGEVVGFAELASNPFIMHAIIVRASTMYDLNDLIDPADPLARFVTLVGATAINDSGWIVAGGTDSRDGGSHSYLLTLEKPPIELARVRGGCREGEGGD